MQNWTVNDLVRACGGVLLCGDGDTPVEHISLDSRKMEGSDLFVPLIGEKVDAHRFILQALNNGAVATLTSEHGTAGKGGVTEGNVTENSGTDGRGKTAAQPVPMDENGVAGYGKAWIAVDDTKLALQAIGRAYRRTLTLPLVGITGSVGKTTTKEMVAAALSAGLRTYKTKGSRNSQVGVPVTITDIDREDQIGVIELGMSEPGELTVIARMAQVDVALITNIGVAHIEQLGSQENIFREKMTIRDGLTAGGILLLNGDDPFLAEAEAGDGFRTVRYGTTDGCDYRATEIHMEKGCPVFTAECRYAGGKGAACAIGAAGGQPGREPGAEKPRTENPRMEKPLTERSRTVTVRLKVMGAHQILNAVAAIAVADLYGVPLAAAAEKLSEYEGMKGRQQVRHAGGITVIDDTYNANPVSMKGAIDILVSVEDAARRIAVLADMKELGAESPRFHREIGEYIAQRPVDLLVTYGELAKDIGAGIRTVRFAESEKREMMEWLGNELRAGDCVLFKGSNSMNLGEAADDVCQRHH